MKKPVIASLDTKERQELIEHIHKSSLANDDKEVVVEALNFYNDLLEKLKSSKISINQLKQMLVGFKADNIKKLLQIHYKVCLLDLRHKRIKDKLRKLPIKREIVVIGAVKTVSMIMKEQRHII